MINMEICMEMSLGSPSGQFKVMPVALGKGQPRGFAAFFSGCYDIDSSYDMFVFPSDALKAIVFTERGEILWKKEVGIIPGAAFYNFYVLDLDRDGVDEIFFVNNSDPEHPFAFEKFVLERVDTLTGQTTGQWPWPCYGGYSQSLQHTFRNHIFGGMVGAQPVLVTAQGTYGDMFLQGWNPDLSLRWERTITKTDPGARGSHSFPVVDINQDGVDEVMWGERCISLATGQDVFLIEPNWHGHSDNCQPVWDRGNGRWCVYINRESDEEIPPRVGLYDNHGNRIWVDVDWGHIHKGWVGRIGSQGELIATAARITGQTKDSVGRYYTGITEFTYDAMTGKPVKLPYSIFDTAPVDVNGDGFHEILRGVASGTTELLDRNGKVLANLGGKVAMNSKILDLPGEQVMCYYQSGMVRIWRDTNAADTPAARSRYSHPFYQRNQRARNIENNICMLGGI